MVVYDNTSSLHAQAVDALCCLITKKTGRHITKCKILETDVEELWTENFIQIICVTSVEVAASVGNYTQLNATRPPVLAYLFENVDLLTYVRFEYTPHNVLIPYLSSAHPEVMKKELCLPEDTEKLIEQGVASGKWLRKCFGKCSGNNSKEMQRLQVVIDQIKAHMKTKNPQEQKDTAVLCHEESGYFSTSHKTALDSVSQALVINEGMSSICNNNEESDRPGHYSVPDVRSEYSSYTLHTYQV